MRLLLFSDLHRDTEAANALVTRSETADVLVAAGDFAVKRKGIRDVLDILRAVARPVVLVPGNGESDDELRRACRGWSDAHVLHGEGVRVGGVVFFGIGGAVPETPFGAWSFDLSEDAAAELLRECPEGAVLVSHSPPFGHCDARRRSSGNGPGGSREHLGSRAVLDTVRRVRPSLVVCGHVHDAWGQRSDLDGVPVINAGPSGTLFELGGPVP